MRFIKVMKGSLNEHTGKRREELMREIFGDSEFEQMEKERKSFVAPEEESSTETIENTPNGHGQNGVRTIAAPKVEEVSAEPPKIEQSWFGSKIEEKPVEVEESMSLAPTVRTQEEILAKNTNYVFIFGYTGSGKSTVLTAINMYMRQHYRVILNQSENQEGIRLIHEMMRDLETGRFPQPTSIGNITEYDTAFTIEGEEVNLTFLEMAGEDLKKVDVEEGEEGLSDELLAYLRCPGISISFLLVADYERVVERKEDKLILQFLSYLYSEGIDMSRIGVILSKFDKGRTDLDVEQVIQNYLPQVDKWLKSDDISHPRVFPFSVGKINSYTDKKDDIEEMDLEDCGEVVPWLHEVLALPGAQSRNRPQAKETMGEKIKNLFRF